LLAKCAATTLSSKLIGGEKEFFASMVVDAVLAIGHDDRLNLIGIKKVISFDGESSRILSFSSTHSNLSPFNMLQMRWFFLLQY
jgi:chaperonin GroEL (HSP60 family)